MKTPSYPIPSIIAGNEHTTNAEISAILKFAERSEPPPLGDLKKIIKFQLLKAFFAKIIAQTSLELNVR